MSTIDQQFVEYVIKNLVNYPDDVTVERKIDEKGVLLTPTVNPDDLGRVIGRRGSTAQSLRTLLRALGTKNNAHYNLKIVNNDQQQMAEITEATEEAEPAVENFDEIAKNTREELEKLDDLDI